MFLELNGIKIRKDRIESFEKKKIINDDYIPEMKFNEVNVEEEGDKYIHKLIITTFSGAVHILTGSVEEIAGIYDKVK